MSHLGWLAGIVLLGTGLSLNVVAESHRVETSAVNLDESILVAIKEALVSEAQSTESKVINTSWLDAKGQLHESTMVHSGMRIRGIQVQAYLDAMQKPKVEISLDEKEGLLPECFAKDDHLKRTVRVMPVQMLGDFETELQPIAAASADILRHKFAAYFENSEYWHVKRPEQQANAYQRLVSGLRPDPVHYELEVMVSRGLMPKGQKSERIPGSDPVSTFFKGAPSAFAEDWIHLKVQLLKVTTGELVWTRNTNVRVPVRPVTYTNKALPDVMANQIRKDVGGWISLLNEYAMCQPVNFRITGLSGSVYIDGGATSGLKKGDRLLVIDQARVPDRVLESGALAELSLALVVKVEGDSAIIEHVAGAPLIEATGKVALPF
ncbi:MAG: hypothetical protein VW907_00885 [Opitutae bacterium]